MTKPLLPLLALLLTAMMTGGALRGAGAQQPPPPAAPPGACSPEAHAAYKDLSAKVSACITSLQLATFLSGSRAHHTGKRAGGLRAGGTHQRAHACRAGALPRVSRPAVPRGGGGRFWHSGAATSQPNRPG
jgi:hypothetical protein